MKILIVRTYPSILDSSHYNIQEIGLAKALAKLGNEVGVVLYNGHEKDRTETVSVNGREGVSDITVYHLHGYQILKNGFFPSLKKIVKLYDVIQVHEYDQITSWFYYAWSKKKVVIYHGPYYDAFNKRYNLKCKIFDSLFLKLKNNRERICFTKSYAAAEFLKSKGFQYAVPVGVGLDPDNFKTGDESRKVPDLCKQDQINLLYVGKIEERRNSLFLLDVFGELCKERNDIHCIVVGNGEEEYLSAFLEKAKPLLQSGRMEYCKSLPQTDIAELYQNAQLMIFPTNYDIFGMVVLEALYYNLPVVSSFNGAADMLIQDDVNGKIVNNFDVKDWRKAIDTVLKTENYQKIKKNLESVPSTRYTWDGVADIMMKELRK